ncbi:MAG: 5-formyltetrahydrofolate cyclo-ligase [Kiloniellales bacterium]|nr:5-formyltetrahydrofolate cyclo-ligase [Kiloniellales bacterium]
MTKTLEAKAALRRSSRQIRRAAAEERESAAAEVCRRLLDALVIPAEARVSGYWPLRDELDPRPVLEALAARGRRLCLPVVVESGAALVFRSWRPDAALEPAVFGTRVPGPDCPSVEPDILLVPLLAFDRRGRRLGYGGGFYDRTLAALRGRRPVLAIGLAFAAQEVEEVPVEAGDEALDRIVTEREVIAPRDLPAGLERA